MNNSSQTLLPGTSLQGGKYRIEKVLGQGGFGITYLAEQVTLDRYVAIKEFFMKESCERDAETSRVSAASTGLLGFVTKFRDKFIREARMIARMDHPNIVKVHDIFEENGTAYYVMENLSGGSLQDLVNKKGKLEEDEALGYIHQVASALDHVHSLHSVHLDVKPSNVLLSSSGKAVLIDFGISKHYDEEGQQTSSTPVGISKGYAPLEQSRSGDVSQFTPATDIYALGATLYCLVTGSAPPEASIIYEDGLGRPAGISDGVWNAIEKAMQPRRKDRSQSVDEFMALLPSPEISPLASLGRNDKETSSGTPVVISSVAEKSHSGDNTVVNPSSNEGTIIETDEETATAEVKPVQPKKKSLTWLYVVVGAIVAALSVFVLLPGKEGEVLIPAASQGVVSESDYNGHDYVDLGLSVKWATCNVGASSPEDYGDYFAWGETSTKSKYTWSNLKYCTDNSGDHFSKYVPSDESSYWGESGRPDNKTRLDLEDDAAHVKWGGTWRTPTYEEWEELIDKCNWSWTGSGYKVTSKTNGQSIILPAAGYRYEGSTGNAGSYGNYWSSSLYTDYPSRAWYVYFYSEYRSTYYSSRCNGRSVRPVTE